MDSTDPDGTFDNRCLLLVGAEHSSILRWRHLETEGDTAEDRFYCIYVYIYIYIFFKGYTVGKNTNMGRLASYQVI